MGLLTTDLKYDAIRTAFQLSTDVDFERLQKDYGEMEEQLKDQFARDGIGEAETLFHRYADARYVGQGYELRIDISADTITGTSLAPAFQRFHELHEGEYGHCFPDSPIELVNIRVTGVGPVPKIDIPERSEEGSIESALIKKDETAFRVKGDLKTYETSFYRRELLPVDTEIAGPSIILQTDTTTVIPPDCSFRADKNGLLLISVSEYQFHDDID